MKELYKKIKTHVEILPYDIFAYVATSSLLFALGLFAPQPIVGSYKPDPGLEFLIEKLKYALSVSWAPTLIFHVALYKNKVKESLGRK